MHPLLTVQWNWLGEGHEACRAGKSEKNKGKKFDTLRNDREIDGQIDSTLSSDLFKM